MTRDTASVSQGLVYALLADGTTVEIRPAGPGDLDAVQDMHQAMSPDNTYMRFFNIAGTRPRPRRGGSAGARTPMR